MSKMNDMKRLIAKACVASMLAGYLPRVNAQYGPLDSTDRPCIDYKCQTYKVQKGDTLYSLSKRHYHGQAYSHEIMFRARFIKEFRKANPNLSDIEIERNLQLDQNLILPLFWEKMAGAEGSSAAENMEVPASQVYRAAPAYPKISERSIEETASPKQELYVPREFKRKKGSEAKKPFYKKWLFWTIVGVAVGGGVAAARMSKKKGDDGGSPPPRPNPDENQGGAGPLSVRF